MASISVTVKYFAILREQSGKSEENLIMPESLLRDIYSSLAEKYSFTLPISKIKAAVNDQFCEMNYTPKDGDKIVFIPPVAGG